MNQFDKLWPYPKKVQYHGEEFAIPKGIFISGESPFPSLRDDLQHTGISVTGNPDEYNLELLIDDRVEETEGYSLSMNRNLTRIAGSDKAGLAYGLQTFLQILAIYHGTAEWPELLITDRPTYKKRCFMLDLGRSVFNMPILKRIIRILARLKMNQLHLHRQSRLGGGRGEQNGAGAKEAQVQ